MTNIITIAGDNGQFLHIDADTGSIVDELSDQGALYWSEYLVGLTRGLAGKLEKFGFAPEGALRATLPLSVAVQIVQLVAIPAAMQDAASAREAVQIGAAGIAEFMWALSAGYLTGAALGWTVAAMAGTMPVWIITCITLATLGVATYFFTDLVNDYLERVTKAIAGGLFDVVDFFVSFSLQNLLRDPLVLDLDGDGIEVSALAGSTVHFDYDQDGFAEKTGWVSADDGILVVDSNGNGLVDGAAELFGSPTQDGFAVLETYDTNGDGRIDAADDAFGTLRVWRDLDQDGASDAGEMMTLVEAGITSISLSRTDVTAANNGHAIGFEAQYTRADGTIGNAQTIYFQTDRRDTRADNTPNFTPATSVERLPKLPGSGQINSIAWKATQDTVFREAWTALTDEAANLSRDELRARFEDLMLRWASVEGVAEGSRGQYVDARHLTFVEKFFGTTYQEIGAATSTSPTTAGFGARIEVSFDQVVDVMLTSFLAQNVASVVARGGSLAALTENPYFPYALLDFRSEWPTGTQPPATPGNVGAVLELIKGFLPEQAGAAARFLEKALAGMDGVSNAIFAGDRAAYLAVAQPVLAGLADAQLRLIATEIVKGTAALGSNGADGLLRLEGDNLFIGGKGDDLIVSGEGSDLFVYSRGDGSDYIRDTSTSLSESDTLFFTDIAAAELTFERLGDDLIIKIAGSTDKIVAQQFFEDWGTKNRSIDQIRLKDGVLLSREDIRSLTTTVGDGRGNLVQDTSGDDVLRGGKGSDTIKIGAGNDTILYAAGDGFDILDDTSGVKSERDTLVLTGLDPSDVMLSRAGDALVVKILSTGEYVTDKSFFLNSASPDASDGWIHHGYGIDRIQFGNGMVWDRQAIQKDAWIRGDDRANGLAGSGLNDTFAGGLGNDTLSGGLGSDTYIWRRGDGSDQIVEDNNSNAGIDRLVLQDVPASGVQLARQGDDLLITVSATNEVIRIVGQYKEIDNLTLEQTDGSYGIERLQFANGVEWDRQQIAIESGKNSIGKVFTDFIFSIHGLVQYWYFIDEFGNRGDIYSTYVSPVQTTYNGHDMFIGNEEDNVFGYPELNLVESKNNYFDGKEGNDILYGGEHDDTLIGGAGDDVLYGAGKGPDQDEVGQDVLQGDAGNDILYGGAGNDILKGGQGSDKLYGGAGSDYLQDEGLDDDIFEGGLGDDVIAAGAAASNGSDTYIYGRGDGNDTIEDLSSSITEVDKLVLTNIASTEVELSRSTSTLFIKDLATGQTITVAKFFDQWGNVGYGVDEIRFADNVTWGRGVMAENAWYRGSVAADNISLSGSSDTVAGGLGDDRIFAGAYAGASSANGSDTYVYRRGDGNDTIDDASASIAEVDKLVLSNIGSAEVELSRNASTLFIKDIVTGQSITVEWFFDLWGAVGYGIDEIQFADNVIWNREAIADNAWYRGSVVSDSIRLSNANNTVSGGLGDDVIFAGAYAGASSANGSDTYVYRRGDGNDIIDDTSSSTVEVDRLVLSNISSTEVELSRTTSGLLIKDIVTGQTITIERFFDSWGFVGYGVDEIQFANNLTWNREVIRYWSEEGSRFYAGKSSSETVIGSYLDQRLSGANGDDFIDGKGGADLIFGDSGNDTLAMTVAEAGDVDALDGGEGVDTASFKDFGAAVWVDLVENQGEAKTSDAAIFSDANARVIATLRQLENVTGSAFDDRIYGDSINNVLAGGAGADMLDGRSGNDTFIGGMGDDTLVGYLGSDTFVYTRGDGDDVVTETVAEVGAIDRIKLLNVDPSDVQFVHLNGNLVIQIASSAAGAGGTITLVGPTSGVHAYDEYGIEIIEFGNGAIWDRAFLHQKYVADSATDGDDVLVGTSASGAFRGRKGNDSLAGAGGGDSYFYARGDGSDTIIEPYNTTDFSADQLVLEGINPSGVTLSRSGNDAILVIAESTPGAGDGGSITLKDSVSEYYGQGIEKITFADGTIWSRIDIRVMLLDLSVTYGTTGNDTITGSASSSDMIDAGAGDDYLKGEGGGDIYLYRQGDGSDTINDNSGSTVDIDTLKFADLNAADLTFSREGQHIKIKVNSTGEIITVLYQFFSTTANWGIEKIVFADNTEWGLASINANAWLRGTAAADTLIGTGANEHVVGDLGNDTLKGEGGSDTYFYKRGDGSDIINDNSGSTADVDTLKLTDLNAADITLSREGEHLKIKVNSTGEVITALYQFYSATANWGIEKIVFADNSEWNLAAINANAWIRGTVGNDTIAGTGWNDVFLGGTGDDRFDSRAGSDTFIYVSGDGSDYIDEESGSTIEVDTVRFTDLNAADLTFARSGVHLTITVNATGHVITMDEQFYSTSANWGIDRIEFANGNVWDRAQLQSAAWIRGTAGNDTIVGTAWNDGIYGAGGDDTLTGGVGSDTFIFRAGFGKDTVTDFAVGAASADVIEFSNDVFADFASVLAAASQVGTDAVLTFDAANTLTLKNVALANLHQDDFRFVA